MRTRRVCALLGIDSGIEGATRDSNFSSIQLSILDENEVSEHSNCINRGLEHWFQSYFQVSLSHSHSRCLSLTLSWSSIFSILRGYSSQHYIYNDCFPKCEIPEWFCHQSGSLLKIRLPPNLYTNSDWIGIALFATLIHSAQASNSHSWLFNFRNFSLLFLFFEKWHGQLGGVK